MQYLSSRIRLMDEDDLIDEEILVSVCAGLVVID